MFLVKSSVRGVSSDTATTVAYLVCIGIELQDHIVEPQTDAPLPIRFDDLVVRLGTEVEEEIPILETKLLMASILSQVNGTYPLSILYKDIVAANPAVDPSVGVLERQLPTLLVDGIVEVFADKPVDCLTDVLVDDLCSVSADIACDARRDAHCKRPRLSSYSRRRSPRPRLQVPSRGCSVHHRPSTSDCPDYHPSLVSRLSESVSLASASAWHDYAPSRRPGPAGGFRHQWMREWTG